MKKLDERAKFARKAKRTGRGVAPYQAMSTLTRIPGESWHDAVVFQASERDDDTAELAENFYNHYVSCGETPEAAADLASYDLMLPARTI